MAGSFRRYEIINHSPSPFFCNSSLIFDHHDVTSFDLFNSNPFTLHTPLLCDTITDLIETTPFHHTNRVIHHRAHRVDSSELYLREICDRVSSLESKFDRMLEIKKEKKKMNEVDRKYSWTAEMKGKVDKKYKWTAEIEGDDVKKGKFGERKYKWITEFKDEDDNKKTYTWQTTIGGENNKKKKKEKKEIKKDESCGTRIVEIEEPFDHRTLVLRQAFAKRAVAAKNKGKKKELSAQDAAFVIQMSFRAYLIRRSKTLRALRELAVAKTKLKELRSLFHNFSYRSRVARDAEERQKFSEKIIVLLLTVDAIEDIDIMVRAAKRSMVDELEAMLDVVDPQPIRKSISMRRRTFDMPSGSIQKEIAEGVAQVVQMLDQEAETFEACV